MLELYGAIHSTSAAPAATIFTLPSGYHPTIGQNCGVVLNHTNVITADNVGISTAGAVTLSANVTVTSTDVYFNVRVPMV
jgi:hypothetical protein